MKFYRANGTIRRARFVKLDTTDNNSVLEADANEKVVGIATVGGREAPIPAVTADPPEAAQSGDQVAVHSTGEEDTVLLEAGTGGWTAGDEIESDADGKGVTAAATAASVRNIGAIAMETVAAGELGHVLPVIYTHTNPA